MKEFNEKLNGSASISVDDSNTAIMVKSGSLPVFATPAMLSLMEEATCNACAPLLDEGETSVGTKISVSHIKASCKGTLITASATLDQVDGRRLVFSVAAVDDGNNVIGNGTIERFVVDSEKFMKKAEASK